MEFFYIEDSDGVSECSGIRLTVSFMVRKILLGKDPDKKEIARKKKIKKKTFKCKRECTVTAKDPLKLPNHIPSNVS